MASFQAMEVSDPLIEYTTQETRKTTEQSPNIGLSGWMAKGACKDQTDLGNSR